MAKQIEEAMGMSLRTTEATGPEPFITVKRNDWPVQNHCKEPNTIGPIEDEYGDYNWVRIELGPEARRTRRQAEQQMGEDGRTYIGYHSTSWEVALEIIKENAMRQGKRQAGTKPGTNEEVAFASNNLTHSVWTYGGPI